LDAHEGKLSHERKLVRRVQHKRGTREGDAAFAEIVDLVGDRVFAQILSSVGRPERARELLQETFLRAYQALPRFSQQARLRTWIGAIAGNLCIDESRRQAAGRGQVRSLDDPGEGSGLGTVAILASADPTADAQAIAEEERMRVREAVSDLPAIYRDVVHLRAYEGLSYAEIAEILSCTVGAAKQRMHHATRLLRQVL